VFETLETCYTMSSLKELRQARKMTQRDLAVRLGTTQQTVARWESGQTAVPSNQLRDLARLFEVTVDDLLGYKFGEEPRRDRRFAVVYPDQPFGEVQVTCAFGSRSYPLDKSQREAFAQDLNEVPSDWFAFSTLDGRSVLLNTDQVLSLHFEPSAPIMADQSEDLLVRLIWADGKQEQHPLTDVTATAFERLALGETSAGEFIPILHRDGSIKYINLQHAAVIEFPLGRYLELSAR
jgi:transcriptional regulator with XRE-family HTH domain